VSEIRHAFSKNGGNLGEQGSVAWMFERKSQIIIEKDKATEDQLMEIALEAGADDVRDEGDSWELLSAPESHAVVLEAIHKAGVPTVEAEIAMIPKNPMKVDAKHVGGMLRMLEVMEDHDDTQNVYTNFDYDEDEANG
jgi:transcriptional/translational regulatory protein YebC/TACO1